MCFSRQKTAVKVHQSMTYEEFYEKFHTSLMPYCSLHRFLRENRYRRLFCGNIIRPGNWVHIPRK